MKNAGTSLKNYLASTTNLIMADLWTFTLINGVTLQYTTADIGLNISSDLFTASDVLVEGAELDSQYGTDANETSVTCYPSPNSMAGSVPFLIACASGQFDRAGVTKQRLFMPTWGDASLGAVTIFEGQVSGVSTTRYTAKLTCKDAKNLLNIYMPRRQFQPTCSFTFGDANCGFDRSSLAVATAVTPGSSLSVLLATSLTQAAGYFNNGTVKFTSGLNSGLSRSVKTYNPGYVQLVAPFPNQPQVGDTFNVTPGCNKSFAGPTDTEVGSVVYGTTPNNILNSVGDGPGTYNGDTIAFTSGGLNGETSVILIWLPNEALLETSLSGLPSPGDTFNILDGSGNILTSGSVITPLSSAVIPTSLPEADGFFNGGTLAFTDGALNGQSQTVSNWQDGVAYLSAAFGGAPALGDTFTITSAATATQGSCTGFFGSNAPLHFGGQRFIPVPETAF